MHKYVFGHGLSYATFQYSNLRVDRDRLRLGETATVTVEVTNTSGRQADEVVQLYIHQRYGTSTRPVRELKGFRRITVAAGETRTVSFPVGPDELRYWSAATRSWTLDPASLDLWVGGSSAASLATTLTLVR